MASAGNWELLSPGTKPSARFSHAMRYSAALEGVVLFGGNNGATELNDIWLWNGITWASFSPVGSPPSIREAHMLEVGGDGLIYLFGGEASNLFKNDLWQLVAPAEWIPLTPTTVPIARRHHGMASSVGRGYIDIPVGTSLLDGETINIQDGVNIPIIFEFDDNNIVSGSNIPVRIGGSNEQMLIKLADAINASVLFMQAKVVNNFRIHLQSTNSAPYMIRIIPTVADPNFAVFSSPRFWMWGGETNATYDFYPTTPPQIVDYVMWYFDDVASNWVPIRIPGSAPQPAPRSLHTMWADYARGKIVIYGGSSLATSLPLDDLWEWDAIYGGWTLIQTSVIPEARAAWHNMSYDTRQKKAVCLSAGRHAVGYIDTVDYSLLIDGETITLNDGVNAPTVFEIDDDASVSGGNIAIDISGSPGPDAIGVRDLIISAVNGVGGTLLITASEGGDTRVNLVNDSPGSIGDVAILHTVAEASFIVFGMNGDDDTWVLNSLGAIWLERFPALQPTLEELGAMSMDAGGEILTILGDSHTDGETFTIDDREIAGSVTFELTSGPPVTPGNIAVSTAGSPSADTMRDRIISAITGSSLAITAQNGGAGRVVLNPKSRIDFAGAEAVRDVGFVLRETSILSFGGKQTSGPVNTQHRWIWTSAGVSPYFSYPGVLQGRVVPVEVVADSVTDGTWNFCLGINQDPLPSFLLNIGDEITLTQNVDMSSTQLWRFDWRMRYSLDNPVYLKVVDNASVSFKDGSLIDVTSPDDIRGIFIDSPGLLFQEKHENQLVNISGATNGNNNGSNLRLTGIPSGQGEIGYFDELKDQGTWVAGRQAIIENPNIVDTAADPNVTVEVLGARWKAQMFVDIGGGDVLRAELVEDLVQADPNGWQRGSLAAHVSKVAGVVILTFKLSLESITS